MIRKRSLFRRFRPTVRAASVQVAKLDVLEPRPMLAAPVLGVEGPVAIEGVRGQDSAVLGDTNGDGVSDFAVTAGATDSQPGGVVTLLSGADLTPLASGVGPSDADPYGNQIAALGDINDDGVADLAVFGDDVSTVFILSGTDLSVLRTHAGAFTASGIATATASGDVDGDGVEDYVIGLAGGDSLDVISGDGGQVLRTITTNTDAPRAYAAGDLDGDGVGDVAYGRQLNVFSAVDGAAIEINDVLQPDVVGEIGDFDGDGVADTVAAGRSLIFSIRDGDNYDNVLAELEDEPDEPIDFNEDGVEDFVQRELRPTIQIFSGADRSLIASIDRDQTVEFEFEYSESYGLLGDTNGDGLREISYTYGFNDLCCVFVYGYGSGVLDVSDGTAQRVEVFDATDIGGGPLPLAAGPLGPDGKSAHFYQVFSDAEAQQVYGVSLISDGPALILHNAVTDSVGTAAVYEEAAPAVPVFGSPNSITLTDDGLIRSLEVRVENFVPGEDILQGGSLGRPHTSTFDTSTGTLTITADDPNGVAPSFFASALQNVRYRNRSTTPDETTRQITATVTDDEGLTASVSGEVRIIAAFDPPQLGLSTFGFNSETGRNEWAVSTNPVGEDFATTEVVEVWVGGDIYDKVTTTREGGLLARNSFNGSVFYSRYSAETQTVTGRDYVFELDPATPWSDIYAGDFTGNGGEQFAVRNLTTGEWSYFRIIAGTNGARVFNRDTSAGRWAAIEWDNVRVADFDGDGADEIMGHVAGGSGYYVASLNANDNFSSKRWGALDRRFDWEDITTGDFNGDGKTDFVAVKADSNSLYTATSNGSQFLIANSGGLARTGEWSDLIAGDFDGDGSDDIASRRLATAVATPPRANWFVGIVQPSNSRFQFSVWDAWTNTRSWESVQAGDFTGDGQDDILGILGDNGRIYVAESDGTSFDTPLWGALPEGLTPASASTTPLEN